MKKITPGNKPGVMINRESVNDQRVAASASSSTSSYASFAHALAALLNQ